jgi:putative flippase GtrA
MQDRRSDEAVEHPTQLKAEKVNLITKQFMKFCLVGAGGVIVNAACFYVCYSTLQWPLPAAWGAGVGASVGTNFILNKFYTFKEV